MYVTKMAKAMGASIFKKLCRNALKADVKNPEAL